MMSRAHPKHWSYVAGEKGRNRVRVYPHPTSGRLYLEYQQDGQKTRTALGHLDREEAKRQADEMAARLRRPEVGLPERTTLAQLFDNYLREVTPIKGEHAQRHDRRASRLILEIMGPARVAAQMTHRDAARYVHERRRRGDQRGKEHKGQPLRHRGIEQDLKLLQAVLNWAVGAGWLDRNPLKGFRHQMEGSARRPIVTADQYEALLAVADQIGGTFKLVLILVHETGHRIGAVLQLKWSDVDLKAGSIKWRGEADKIGYEHVTPLTSAALEALLAARKVRKAIGEGWVVPSAVDPSKPASRHLLRDWWQRAQDLAKLPPEPGRGWHSLRRKFATELKHAPLKDLCALGGWKSPQTILLCYQRADSVTMREALASRMRLQG